MGRCKCGVDTGWGYGSICRKCSRKKEEEEDLLWLEEIKKGCNGSPHELEVKFTSRWSDGDNHCWKIEYCKKPSCRYYRKTYLGTE